jgi:hypothetical protein
VPEDPANAPVWREIVDHLDQPGFEGNRISVTDTPREAFSVHPWAIGGGGASELKEQLDSIRSATLAGATSDIGVIGRSSADEAFVASPRRFDAKHVSANLFAVQIAGDCLREWHVTRTEAVLFPYCADAQDPEQDMGFLQWLWPCRTTLGNRATFSQRTYFEEGKPWWSWHQLSPQRLSPPTTIAYGEIATHNHFVLDCGGKVFNQTAPVIKLSTEATPEDHLELLGLLNSSTACFWLKQICFPKGGDHVGTEGARVTKNQWEERYAFDSTKLKQFPIPNDKPLSITKLVQAEIDARSALLPERLCVDGVPTLELFSNSRAKAWKHFGRMIALQEELDWQCYRLYARQSNGDWRLVAGFRPDDEVSV